jgi:hypothetical protein
MTISKTSFVENAIIHVSFVEDLRNMIVKHVNQTESDIQLLNTFIKFH